MVITRVGGAASGSILDEGWHSPGSAWGLPGSLCLFPPGAQCRGPPTHPLAMFPSRDWAHSHPIILFSGWACPPNGGSGRSQGSGRHWGKRLEICSLATGCMWGQLVTGGGCLCGQCHLPRNPCSSPFWRVGTKTLPGRTQGAGATLLALWLPSSPTSQHRAVGLGEACQLLNAPKTHP